MGVSKRGRPRLRGRIAKASEASEGRGLGFVLLVEDDPGAAALVKGLLSSAGRDRVVQAMSLAGALSLLATTVVDLILLDLHLPDASGVDLVRALRASAWDVPIVVLLEPKDETSAVASIAAGAQDHLAKSELSGPPLRRAIDHALSRAREAIERRHADALEECLDAIVEASSDGIVSATPEGFISSWNAGAEHIFGCPRGEAIGAPLGRFLRPIQDGSADGERYFVSRAVDEVELTDEAIGIRNDGSSVVLSVSLCRLRWAGVGEGSIVAVCRATGDRGSLDKELRRTHAELVSHDRQMRALTARLNEIREEERKRIAREVHDELGQLLTGLKLDLAWVTKRLGAAPDASITDKLDGASQLIDRTIKTVQRIATELRPPALDALGLPEAIHDEVRRFEVRSGVKTEVQVEVQLQPDAETATALFRIVQELLTNVARHARATLVRVVLTHGESWTLRVEDDGVGPAGWEAGHAPSLGLLGMRERAEALGGAFVLVRGRLGGTIATVCIPVRRWPSPQKALSR